MTWTKPAEETPAGEKAEPSQKSGKWPDREPGPEPGRSFWRCRCGFQRSSPMNGLIYLVGLVVVVMAILSFFGLR